MAKQRAFVAYKKAWTKGITGHGRRETVIVKLGVPEGAARTGRKSVNGGKIRVERAVVLSITSGRSKKKNHRAARSNYDHTFEYRLHEQVEPNNGYTEDYNIVCAGGIHCFLTEEEARNYDFM